MGFDEKNEIRVAVLLRALLGLGLGCLVVASPARWSPGLGDWVLIAFFASNLPVLTVGDRRITASAKYALLVVDTITVSLLVASTAGSLALVFFLVVMVVAVGENWTIQVVSTSCLAALHAWFAYDATGVLSTQLLLPIPFFFSVALYYSYMLGPLRTEHAEAEKLTQEHRELHILSGLIQEVSAPLEPGEVLQRVVDCVAGAIHARRISAVQVDRESRRATVLASTDRDQVPIELQWDLYPELHELPSGRDPVLIQQADSHARLWKVRERLKEIGVHSLLLVPLAEHDERYGRIVLHANSEQDQLDPDLVNFFRSVSTVVCNALKSAMLNQRLAAKAEELRNIFHHSPDLIVTLSEQGTILATNRGAQRMLAAEGGALESRPIRDFFPDIDFAHVARQIDLEDTWVNHEARLLTHGRQLREADITVAALDSNHERRYLLVGRDISEINSSRRALKKADRLRGVGELASVVAHELNNALTGVIGHAQVLAMRGEMEDETKTMLERIGDSANRCAKIVKNLLRFGRQRSAEMELSSVNSLLDAVLELYAYRLRSKRIKIEKSYGDVPATLLAPHRMEQVFLNLLQNSFQAISRREGAGSIELHTARVEDRIVIEIRDDGCGVPETIRDRIFEAFFTTSGSEASGLGLAIAAGIVNDHCGSLEFIPTETGATFRIELPIRRKMTADRAAALSELERSIGATDGPTTNGGGEEKGDGPRASS